MGGGGGGVELEVGYVTQQQRKVQLPTASPWGRKCSAPPQPYLTNYPLPNTPRF